MVWLGFVLGGLSCGGPPDSELVAQRRLALEDLEAPSWTSAQPLTVTARTPTRVSLQWAAATDNVGVAGYRIRRGSSLLSTVGATASQWVDGPGTGLLPGMSLSYHVEAFDAEGNAASTSVTTSTQAPSAPPTWPLPTTLAATEVGRRRVELQWPRASDDYDEVIYTVDVFGSGGGAPLFQWGIDAMAAGASATVTYRSPSNLSPGTTYTFALRVTDFEGHPAEPVQTVQLTATTLSATAPQWPSGATLSLSPLGPIGASIEVPRALEAASYHCEFRANGGAWSSCWEGYADPPVFSAEAPAPGATVDVRVSHLDEFGAESAFLEGTITLPSFARPAEPPLDPTSTTDLWGETSYLFEGPSPGQMYVQPGALARSRLSVLLGRVIVRDAAGATAVPVANARVSLRDQDIGWTYTDADGRYMLAVNGGGPVVLDVQKSGMLSAQRRVDTRHNEYASVPDIALVERAAGPPTTVTFGGADQRAVSALETDAHGSRRAVVAFPAGVTAVVVDGEENETPLAVGNLRIREYTVGPRGELAMPATIPANVAYTWCADFSFDEADPSTTRQVRFSQPVPIYVDNFMGFHTGAPVPSGSYDEGDGAWVTNELGNGVVLAVLDAEDSQGAALLDLDGDGVWTGADETAATTQGITSAERVGMRQQYPSGASIWRFRVSHFSKWDANWGIWPPEDAIQWTVRDVHNARTEQHVDRCQGSIVECQNRTLGEVIPLEGAGTALTHWSDRSATYSNVFDIPYGTAPLNPPSTLIGVIIEILVDGALRHTVLLTTTTLHNQHADAFSAAPPWQEIPGNGFQNGRYTWTWDGLTPREGQAINRPANAQVRVGYVYRSQPARVERFGYNGNGIEITDVGGNRGALVLWNDWYGTVGALNERAQGIGGWRLAGRHHWDPRSRTVFLSDGSRRGDEATGLVSTRIANGQQGMTGEGIPLPSALVHARHIAVTPSGSLWFTEDCRIRRVTPEGNVQTDVGDAYSCGCSSAEDTPLSANPSIAAPGGIAVINDRVIAFTEPSCNRVRAVVGDMLVTIAGNGNYFGYGSADSGPSREIPIGQPEGIAHVPDEQYLLVAARQSGRVYRIDYFLDHAQAVAGGPSGGVFADNVGATEREFFSPSGVTALRRGGFAFTDDFSHQVFHVGVNGRVRLRAGNQTAGFGGDGGPSNGAVLNTPTVIHELRDGSLAFIDQGNARVRAIGVDGAIRTIIGTGQTSPVAWGRPALRTNLSAEILGFAEGPDGALFVADYAWGSRAVARFSPALPGFQLNEVAIPSADGGEIWAFDGATNCHLRTVDALTGVQRLGFEYETPSTPQSPKCLLRRVIHGPASEGNATEIVRNGPAETLVRGPFYGPGTTEENRLVLDSNGYLDRVEHEDQTWDVTHSAGGLLTSLVDPLGREHSFQYAANGLLERDTNLVSGTSTQLYYASVPTSAEVAVGRVVGEVSATGPAVVHRVLREGRWITEVPAGAGGALVTTEIAHLTGGSVATEVRAGSTVLSHEESQQSDDPRFGAIVPFASMRQSTVGDRTVTAYQSRQLGLEPGTSTVAWTEDATTVGTEGQPRITTRYDRNHSECDGSARVLTTTRGGRRTRACLNTAGRVSRMEVLDASPPVHPIVYGYDTRGRLSTTTQGEHRMRTVYRADGRVESTVFEQSSGAGWATLATHGTSYDSHRRPSAMSLPGGVEIGLSVDRMHQLTTLTPPSRSAHTMGYDGEGRMDAFTSPAATQAGSPMTLEWRYNARRQLDRITRADTSTVSMTFDPTTTALTDVTVPGLGVLHRARRPLTGATDYVDAPNGCRERISYEFEGEVSPNGVTLESVPGQTCPVTGAVTVGRNALGEGTSLTVAGAPAVAFAVDVDPDRLLTSAGGMTLTPDPATGRLTAASVGLVSTGQTYTAYGTPATLTSTVNGTLRHGFAYTPDAMGRIATITETGETPRVTTYAYDSAGRLWQVWRDGTQVAQYEHLGTDGANGNRTAWSAGGHTFTASYDGQDRLTGYTDDGTATTLVYDPHGNVLTRTTGADETRYTWDPRGPLAGVQRPGGAALIEYVLDPAGRRIGRRVGGALERGWLYAGGLLPVAETDADGHTVRRVFVYATRPNVPDLVHQLEGASWVTYRVLVDHLGSVRSVVRASDGALMQRMDYDAFGVVLDDWSASGWVRIPFGFAGGLYDRETGLVRFGAREYDARVGRWVSRDPALFGGGDSNLYRYCGGEPVNRIDPEGRAFMLVGIIFGVPIVGVVYVGVRAYNEWQQALWETERRAVALREDRQRNGRESDSPTPGIQADGYAHCVQSCGMQRRMRMTPAPIARVIGACVSAVHEWNDGPSPDSDADLRADAVGRSVSGGEGSCAALCMSIASPGVRAYEMSHPRTVQQSW